MNDDCYTILQQCNRFYLHILCLDLKEKIIWHIYRERERERERAKADPRNLIFKYCACKLYTRFLFDLTL